MSRPFKAAARVRIPWGCAVAFTAEWTEQFMHLAHAPGRSQAKPSWSVESPSVVTDIGEGQAPPAVRREVRRAAMDGAAVMEAHSAAWEHDRSGGVEVDALYVQEAVAAASVLENPCLWEPGTIRTQSLSSVTLSIATQQVTIAGGSSHGSMFIQ